MKKLITLLTFSILIVALCAFLGSCNDECEHVYDNDCDIECNECGETRDTLHIMTDATCTTPRLCTVCGATEGEALGHKLQDATCTREATCTVCGETEGEALGHKWQDATCIEPAICGVCGAFSSEFADHNWDNASCTAPKTCTVCGETEGVAAEHDWADATCIAPKTCRVCGETEGEVAEHLPKDDDGDCTTDVSCSVCNEVILSGNEEHIDQDKNGVCDNEGCDVTVVPDVEPGEEKEPDDNEGGIDLPMDENP